MNPIIASVSLSLCAAAAALGVSAQQPIAAQPAKRTLSPIVEGPAAQRAAQPAPAAGQPGPQGAQGGPQGAEAQQVPWPITLGMRVAQVPLRVPVLDRVVIVPDAATYLDEISRWSLGGRWPVLIEDGFFAPAFVRAFKPASIVRRGPAAPLPADPAAQQRLVERAVAHAWCPAPAARPKDAPVPEAPLDAFKAVGFQPCGVVFASMADPAWTAAAALAAGHGQPIVWLDGSLGEPWSSMPVPAVVSLSETIERGVKGTGLAYGALGDAIDAVTLCRTASGRALVPPGPRFTLPQGASIKSDEAVALTDALCRDELGKRWAVAGWIFGTEARSAYMAMSSLFLDRSTALCFNSYESDGQWGRYGMAEAEAALKEAGFAVTVIDGPQASGGAWVNMCMGGISPDVLLVNSSGNVDFFELWSKMKLRPEQVPIANRPVAMQFIHSWSLGMPEVVDTVGGRWLDHGAYAYVGSVWEPFLSAFVPPVLFTQRFVNLVPFAWCARWTEGPMDALWRVTVIGDPLMTTLGPRRPRPPRQAADPLSAERGERELRDVARDSLVAAKAGDGASDYAAAMRALVLSGDDAVAQQVWAVASAKGSAAAAACAPDALGPLFRAKDADAFLAAFRAAPPESLTLRDRDMLWQLWTPTFSSVKDPATLEWFATQVRERRPYVDLVPLRGAMERAGIRQRWVEAVALASAKAKDPEVQQELERLLGE